MAFKEVAAVCTAQGLTCDTAAQTVRGVRGGVAFRAVLPEARLELAVNVDEKLLPKLCAMLAEVATVTAERTDFGCVLQETLLAERDGASLLALVDAAVAAAVPLAGASFDDTFEKDRESPVRYLCGFLGALAGAIVGVLPWFLTENLLGWQFWYCGILVGMGSFFGYRYLWGAHSTRFALISIGVSTLLAVLLSNAATAVWSVLDSGLAQSVGDAVTYIMETVGITGFFSDALFGLLAAGVGVFLLRGPLLVYTHESNFLRRGRKRK